jgi:hypothetical protein
MRQVGLGEDNIEEASPIAPDGTATPTRGEIEQIILNFLAQYLK